MDRLVLRKIEKKDNPVISKIIKSVLTELNANIKGTAYYDSETDAMFEAYQKPKTVYYVAELNNTVVGGCGIGELENNTCELQKMYILPKARGNKIGFKLLQKCIDFAVKSNYSAIYLETFPQMKTAISLYKKNGFVRLNKSLGNTCHYACNVWMLKPINQTIKDLKTKFENELKTLYNHNEIQSLFYILTEHIFGLKKVDVILNFNNKPEQKLSEKFKNALTDLKNQKPIQYITNKTEFYGLPFFVDENVLIPRPETEELVNWIVNDNKNKTDKLNILDIGTGSGCIAISLKKNLKSNVTGLDISENALNVAIKNSKLNIVDINFIKENILDDYIFSKLQTYDIIVSNPPYVKESEIKLMKNNVLKYEPHTALFVKDNNPLIFYNKIAELAKQKLNPNGKLYFEINEVSGNNILNMLKEKGFKNIVLKKDVFGKDRMVRCELT